jgi:cytochrome c-type biogenesis protein CcmH/NrfF
MGSHERLVLPGGKGKDRYSPNFSPVNSYGKHISYQHGEFALVWLLPQKLALLTVAIWQNQKKSAENENIFFLPLPAVNN